MIDSLRLQKFRSYKDASFEFDSGVNIVIGPNASGKTNLLEAILYLASGKSYRARDFDLVRFEAPWSRLDGFFDGHSRTAKIIKKEDSSDREFVIDNKNYKRLRLELTVPAVLFEPNHLQLLIRGPEQRRAFFDDILERTLAGYKSTLASYRRALAQRNALLKQPAERAHRQLFAWNVRLSELGAEIVRQRLHLLEEMNKNISKTYNQIAGTRAKVELKYDSPIGQLNYSSSLLHKLEKSSELDLARGFTAYGPHREDIMIQLKNKPAGLTASRGETRSIILALKTFELKLVENTRRQKPVFLLDDVFSELDGARRHHLVDSLKSYQTIITTTDADAVVAHFAEGPKLLALT